MDLYGQDRDVELLVALLSRLADRSVIDVGAERGSFVESLLRGGATDVHAIEPEPANAAFLRRRFHGDPRVSVHEYAITATDGPVRLHMSVSPSADPISFGHTLLERPDTDEIAWRETVSVPGRSLDSLVRAGVLPSRVGILKVDTEGNDLVVVSGMGELNCDVVMMEHWSDLPHSLGLCPWKLDDVVGVLGPRGFSKFAFLEHRGEFAILRWNSALVAPGAAGNLLFVHDRVLDDVAPVLLEAASAIAAETLELGERYAAEAGARLAAIEGLQAERPVIGDLARPRPGVVRSRLGFWLRPRIGLLRHHEPKRLTVPAKYGATQAPTPPPTISIVTPALQQGRYLERTLHSVVSQNYPGLEYMVQDGGSSDETLDVLKRFDADLSGWRSEPDGGQGDAINRGFAATTGEIMAWLNADDLLLPGALAYVARYFAANPDVDVVYGDRIMIDEDDRQIGTWVLPAHDDQVLMLADYVPQETLFWRRRAWEAAGGEVDTRFSYALDWDLLVRLRSAGAKIVHVSRFLGAFRVHDEQKTTVNQATGDVECDLIRQRLHGRRLSGAEIFGELKPYLVRHMLADMRVRFRQRVSGRRVVVETAPDGSQPPTHETKYSLAAE